MSYCLSKRKVLLVEDLIREASKRALEGAASVSVPTTDGVSDNSELVKLFVI